MKMEENCDSVQESYPVNTSYIFRKEITDKKNFIDSEFYRDLKKPVILVTLNENNDKNLITDVVFISSFIESEEHYSNAEKV